MRKLVCFSILFFISISFSAGANWRVPEDFPTIQDAINSPLVVNGDRIEVGRGDFFGALVTKSVEIAGRNASTVINDGPLHPAGLTMGLVIETDEVKIENMTFEADLGIRTSGVTQNVEIVHNTFLNAIQAVSGWKASFWNISHNEIIDLRSICGGGIGILIGDYSGGVVEGNEISHNKISGVLHVSPGDCGGYNGSGIVAFADFRWGSAGASSIQGNSILHNSIDMVSDTPAVVDIVAIELTDTRDDASLLIITDNLIRENRFGCTALQVDLTPDELGDENTFEKNKAANKCP